MFKKRILAYVSILVLASACAQPGGGYSLTPNQPVRKADIGTIAGGIGGAFVGSNIGKGSGRTLGIAAGTLLGAFIGNQVGASLDRADMMYYDRTSQDAMETARIGQTRRWTNPDSGNSGSFTPTRTFQTAEGSFCREFTQTVVVGGRTQEAFGTACRQPDGTWRLQN